MSFADTTPVGGIAPLPVGTTPVTLPIKLTDVTGLVPSLLAMPLPGTKVGETLRWDGSTWAAVDHNAAEGWTTVPPTDTSPGEQGQMAAAAGSLYVCIAKDSWIKLTDPGTGTWP